ncbi:MAG: hypothetical protein IPM96_01995 [Ignavibacteria bacterium]|nr:hypothetical protein [Ignavibacteria bacterium]
MPRDTAYKQKYLFLMGANFYPIRKNRKSLNNTARGRSIKSMLYGIFENNPEKSGISYFYGFSQIVKIATTLLN